MSIVRINFLLSWVFAASMVVPNVLIAEDQEPIKIGTVLILTGEGSSWGVTARNGIDMAIEETNAAGGVLGRKLVAIHQDDHGDAKQTISAFRELSEVRGAQFIIGPSWSNLGLSITSMANANKVLTISPTIGVAKFTDSGKYVFSTWPRDTILSKDLAKYVFSKGHKTVALIGAEHVWVKEQTNAFKESFEKLGGKIAFLAEPDPGTSDVRTLALKIKNTPGIDAVVSTTDGVVVGSLVAKALKDLHASYPFFSIALDQAAIDAAQGGFEGLEFLTFVTPTADFKKRYLARYNINTDAGADTAYDAVMWLVQAIRESGKLDADLVADKLASIKRINGASGDLTSDGERGFTKAYEIRKVVDGKSIEVRAK